MAAQAIACDCDDSGSYFNYIKHALLHNPNKVLCTVGGILDEESQSPYAGMNCTVDGEGNYNPEESTDEFFADYSEVAKIFEILHAIEDGNPLTVSSLMIGGKKYQITRSHEDETSDGQGTVVQCVGFIFMRAGAVLEDGTKQPPQGGAVMKGKGAEGYTAIAIFKEELGHTGANALVGALNLVSALQGVPLY